ncbi:hypothetical protein DsansV1_C11g0107301 [Dioscorea sansibarensis]
MKPHNFAFLVIILGAILSASNLAEATVGGEHYYQGTTTAIFLKNAVILRPGGSAPPAPKGHESSGPGHR